MFSEGVHMNNTIHLLDVVALTEDLPEHGLVRGQVGTVVELLALDAFLIEFCDEQGRTYAMLPLKMQQLIVLHFEPNVTQLIGR